MPVRWYSGFFNRTIVNCSVVSCHLESQSAGGAAGEASGKIINSFFVNDTIKTILPEPVPVEYMVKGMQIL